MRIQPKKHMRPRRATDVAPASDRPWIFDLMHDERSTLIATFGGWALDGMACDVLDWNPARASRLLPSP